jgi:hypothetical protein
MAGAFIGLDYAQALALAPDGCDPDALKHHLLRAEAGMIAGLAKLTESEKPDGGQE